mmetsp:Transcript_17795/g.35818  ORF Transcript_17795/g.35818 Transcript_17795/m.35818 type:complete len:138 (+) Transcript_17795:252-665(+)
MAPKDVSEREITMAEVSKHNTEKDCWLVIGNATNGGPKVYDVTSYLDDHPGGAEVMLDVAGQDADEFFEDIGHSNDAREELEKHIIGVLKMDAEELKRRAAEAEKAASKSGGGGANVFLIVIVLAAIGFAYYKTQMA